MPKPNDLKLLEQVLVEPTLRNPNYFLFMLGTDTYYTPLPTKDSVNSTERKRYENGETLSYMAQVVASTLGEKAEVRTDQPLSFSTPSVDLINGPRTMGAEVGERIAQGVFLILKALAEGKSTIQLAGHSRGSMESILIVHEIERIKAELHADPRKTIYQILCASPCAYTRTAVQKQLALLKNEWVATVN